VLEALNPWQAQGLVQLEVPDDGRLSTLRTLLKELRPHLLFLSGHGKFHHAPHSGEAPYATFLFEGEEGGSQPVREEEIAAALLGSGVECVVLAACESGMTASDALANGLAWRLSRIGIPHVIGMRKSVVERAGTLFTRAFCDAIARWQPVDVAQLLIRRGVPVFAWSARPGNAWEDFELELELALDADNAERFNRLSDRALDEGRRASVLLRLLLQ
jgi:hypothetical protein